MGFMTTFFSHFSQFYFSFTLKKIFSAKLLLDAPLIPDARGRRLFSLIVKHLPTIFKKPPSLDAHRMDARDRRTPRTPLCTPLLGDLSHLSLYNYYGMDIMPLKIGRHDQ